jgi:hypothetical protein
MPAFGRLCPRNSISISILRRCNTHQEFIHSSDTSMPVHFRADVRCVEGLSVRCAPPRTGAAWSVVGPIPLRLIGHCVRNSRSLRHNRQSKNTRSFRELFPILRSLDGLQNGDQAIGIRGGRLFVVIKI